MPIFILAAFIGVPLLEIAVFIQIGGWLGLWPTLGLVVLTAVIGTWELRAQGLAILARARATVDAGQLPAREMFDGACLLLAGALLLTPGFVTDIIGMLLFIPAVRAYLRSLLARHLSASVETRVYVDGAEIKSRGPSPNGPTIDGEFEDIGGTQPDDQPPHKRIPPR
jgi:UPF0716 protein FxsA